MRIPFARLDSAPRVLRAVIGMRGEAAHGVVPEACAQAFHEASPVLGFGGRVAEHPGRQFIEGNEVRGFDADRLDRPDDLKRGKPLLQETREALARHYLEKTALPVAEISFLLGFDEPNSFYRAFRTWTGTTPERMRDARKKRPRTRDA